MYSYVSLSLSQKKKKNCHGYMCHSILREIYFIRINISLIETLSIQHHKKPCRLNLVNEKIPKLDCLCLV